MPERYTVKPLDSRRVDMAFPVVQSSYPKLDLERWRDYALSLIGAPSPDGTNVIALPQSQPAGVVAAEIGQGYIHGIFAYQVTPNLCHGRVLQVDVFVALNLFDPTAAAEALLAEVERVAKQHRCDAIHLSLPSMPDGPMRDRIGEIGLHPEGVRLCKSMIQVAAE